MFAGGMALNIDSSRRLMRLKKANPDDYSHPARRPVPLGFLPKLSRRNR